MYPYEKMKKKVTVAGAAIIQKWPSSLLRAGNSVKF